MSVKNKILSLTASLLLLTMLTLPAGAVSLDVTDPDAMLPVDIILDQDNKEIRKVYDLSPNTDPSTLPMGQFERDGLLYEIVVLYDGEQHLARLLQPQEDLRYIFVLPHIHMAQELVLPSVPCLFATVDYNGQEVPDVRFYTESEGGRDGAV